jgi:hypothetical protein
MSGFFRSNLEKDFEFFVKNIGKLEPAEFCGLAKVLGVSTLRGVHEIGLTPEDLKGKTEEETRKIVEELTIPTDEILEKMMDKFLGLSKKGRKTVNQILKDIKRGK